MARAQVNVEPNTAVLNEGAQQDLLCRYGRPITYCRIEIPGETKIFNLSPDWDKTPGFIYNGKGLQAGECGVRIEHVKAINNGQVKCNLGVEGEELSGTIDLVVACKCMIFFLPHLAICICVYIVHLLIKIKFLIKEK